MTNGAQDGLAASTPSTGSTVSVTTEGLHSGDPGGHPVRRPQTTRSSS
ncbi:hypothetical protein [Streptomyces hygroscopicus]|nr:hypothetical protein [Streptomyces hygroscopicus]